MTPKEKLEALIQGKRADLLRAEERVELVHMELRTLEQTMRDLFGSTEPRKGGGRPTNAAWKEEQEKLLKALDAGPEAGATTRELGLALYGKFDETIRARINQRLLRGVEKGTIERVSEGHFRIRRNGISVVTDS